MDLTTANGNVIPSIEMSSNVIPMLHTVEEVESASFFNAVQSSWSAGCGKEKDITTVDVDKAGCEVNVVVGDYVEDIHNDHWPVVFVPVLHFVKDGRNVVRYRIDQRD